MFNLKQSNVGITKEIILNCYSEEELFTLFLGYTPKVGNYYKTPFPRKDNRAGCRFKYRNNQLFFIENAGWKGRVYWDCFSLGMELNNQSLSELCYDIFKRNPNKQRFNIQQEHHKFKCDIRIIKKEWDSENYFTRNFDIDPSFLTCEEIFNVKEYFVNTKNNYSLQRNLFGKFNDQIAYYFPESQHIKLYFPNNNPDNQIKWYSNADDDDVYNWNKLNTFDFKLNKLIITKSGKDCLILNYYLPYPVIAVQQENSYLPKKILEFIKTNNIIPVLLYDNSDTDSVKVEKIVNYYKDYNIEYFFYPKDSKDTAEYYLKYGKTKMIEYINKNIN